MKFGVIKGIKHYVFDSTEEFNLYFNSIGKDPPAIISNWRDGQEGDWVVADDGGIVQVYKRYFMRHYNDTKTGTRYQKGTMQTIVGNFVIRDNLLMDTDFKKHPSRVTFSGKKFLSKDEKVSILSNFHLRFIAYIITGKTPVEAVSLARGTVFRESYAQAWARFLLRQPIIMDELRKQVDSAAKVLKLDHAWVLGIMKDLAEGSEEDSVKRLSAKDIGNAIGTWDMSEKKSSPLLPSGFQGFLEGKVIDAPDISRPNLTGDFSKQIASVVEIPPLNYNERHFLGMKIAERGFDPKLDRY